MGFNYKKSKSKRCKKNNGIKIEHQMRDYEIIEKVCQIILEGESTNIGREITLDRIKDVIEYSEWIERNVNE